MTMQFMKAYHSNANRIFALGEYVLHEGDIPESSEGIVYLAGATSTARTTPASGLEKLSAATASSDKVSFTGPTTSRHALFAKLKGGTAVAGLGLVAFVQPVSAVMSRTAGVQFLEVSDIASPPLPTFSVSASTARDDNETVAAGIGLIEILRAAGSDEGLSRVFLDDLVARFLNRFGEAGVQILTNQVLSMRSKDSERAAAVVASLSTAGEAYESGHVVGALVSLLGSSIPAVRYEASAGLLDLRAGEASSAIAEASYRESPGELRGLLVKVSERLANGG